MKVAVLSESPADEAAIRILTQAVLGRPTEPVDLPGGLRARGWPAVRNVLQPVLKHLHYHTDCEGLVVVVDSNHSPLHAPDHNQAAGCRPCELSGTLAMTQAVIRPVPGRTAVKTAVGLAVPAIEAWYRCGLDGHVTEAAWVTGTAGYTKNSLKEAVYGTERPSLELETQRATEEAHRLSTILAALRHLFPSGFGELSGDLARW